MDRYVAPLHTVLCSTLLIGSIFTLGCAPGDAGSPVLWVDTPLHLEEQLEFASIEGSNVPEDVSQAVVWNFDEAQPEWKVVEPWEEDLTRPRLSQVEDAMRFWVGDVDVTDDDNDRAWGAIYVDLPDWARDDWAHIQVRARSEADVDRAGLMLAFNLRDKAEMEEEAAAAAAGSPSRQVPS